MSKLFNDGEGLTEKVEQIKNDCNDAINTAFRASGVSFMDAMDGVNAETGAMIGGFMTMYKHSMELMTMEAEAMDRILDDLENLKKYNENLSKQNAEMQTILRNINKE